MGRLRTIVSVVLWVLVARQVVAQGDSSLRLHLLPVLPRDRSGAPIEIEASFGFRGVGVLTGDLVLDFQDGRIQCCRVLTPDVTITAPGTSVMVTLPPIPAPEHSARADVVASLRTADGDIDLGFSQIALPQPTIRSQVLAVCAAAGDSTSIPAAAVKRLLISRYDPTHKDGIEHRLSCWPLRLTVEDLPTNSLGFCAYDVLVLTSEAVRELGSVHWQSMRAWIRAGGVACIAVPEQLPPRLRERFQDLLGGSSDDGARRAAFQLLASGAVTGPVAGDVGIGHVVLLPPGEELQDLSDDAFRKLACSLWRVTRHQAEGICANGSWREDQLQHGFGVVGAAMFPNQRRRQSSQPRPPHASFGSFEPRCRQTLVQQLLPDKLRIMPLWLVALVLVAVAVHGGEVKPDFTLL